MPSRSRSRSRDRHKRSRHRSRSRSRSRNSRSPHQHHRSRSSPDGHRSRRRSRSHSRSRSRDRHRGEDSRHRSTNHHREQQHHDADRGHPRSRWEPHDALREQRNGRGWEPDPRDPSRQQQHQQRLPPPPDIGQPRAPLGAPLGRWGAPAPAPVSDEPPPVNSIHRGRVANIRPFGVFISIPGYRRDVLVHHTQVSDMVQLAKDDEDDMKVKALEFVAQRGQEVWVKVTEVTPDASGPGFRLHGSMIFVSQEDGRDLDPTGQLAAAAKATGGAGPLSDEPPEEGSIHRATVKRIEPYGVFVALPGYKRYGLVHSSQVANYLDFTAEDTDEDKKRALAEVVGLGDTAWVKVVEVSPADEAGRGPKIGCSIKLVNQSDGTDLDPQGMRYRPRGEGGGGGGRGRGPIGADAGDVKGGKINWGYLAGEVKHYGDSKYDLLADDPADGPRGPGGPSMSGAAPGAATNGGPPLPPALPPAGRGRGATLPAWMTGGGGAAPGAGPAAPGSLPGPPPMAPGSAAPLIRDVDEAMAILRAAASKQKKSKHKKDKKKHKHKGEKKSRKSDKKHSKSKDRKERRGSRDRGSDSSSSSSGDSSDSDRERQR